MNWQRRLSRGPTTFSDSDIAHALILQKSPFGKYWKQYLVFDHSHDARFSERTPPELKKLSQDFYEAVAGQNFYDAQRLFECIRDWSEEKILN